MSFFPKQPSSRSGATQTVGFDASAQALHPFGPDTYQVRLVASAACCYRISDDGQAATQADIFLPANVIEHVIVSPGQHIAAIKTASNGVVTATPGTLWVTEMA